MAKLTTACGGRGIRTPDTLLAYTRFPGVPLQPLEHHSKVVLSNMAAKIMHVGGNSKYKMKVLIF